MKASRGRAEVTLLLGLMTGLCGSIMASEETERTPLMPDVLSLTEVPYGLPEVPWPERWGHHRACVRVEAPAPAVQVLIPWRRRDHDAERKNVLVIDAATEQRITNVVCIHITREYGVLAFEPPTAPGDYAVYYLPCPEPQSQQYHYPWDYDPPEDTADPAWREQYRLTADELAAGAWQRLPQARTLRLEARTEFDRFDPMEVIATVAETQQLLARHPQPYLVFPEDRRYPIRMTDDLPLRWIQSGPGSSFHGEAQRNEFYVFQIGVYAVTQPLTDLTVECSDQHGPDGAVIPAAAISCFNTGGVNWDGRRFARTVAVPKGKVQALWLGVPIAPEGPPGDYEGTVILRPGNAAATPVNVKLTVRPEVLADRGDGELWRHARLRWLDSTLGMDDEVVEPYLPLEVQGRTVGCLGRAVRIGKQGLWESIRSNGQEILAQPMRWVIETETGPMDLPAGEPEIVHQAPGALEWQAESAHETLTLRSRARMECDGHANFQLTVRAHQDLAVKDFRLEIPLRREIATYLMGTGLTNPS